MIIWDCTFFFGWVFRLRWHLSYPMGINYIKNQIFIRKTGIYSIVKWYFILKQRFSPKFVTVTHIKIHAFKIICRFRNPTIGHKNDNTGKFLGPVSGWNKNHRLILSDKKTRDWPIFYCLNHRTSLFLWGNI